MVARKIVQVLALSWCTAVCAHAQSSAPVWDSVSQAQFDPARSTGVRDLKLQRDRIHITLVQGTIQFVQPVEGTVYAAAFRGTGRIQVEPPHAREAQQLHLFTGEGTLDLEFTEAVFRFNDKTFDEIAAGAEWKAASGLELQQVYRERHNFQENYGGEVLPRLVQAVLAQDRNQNKFFHAELKTNKKGWIFARLDSLDAEEIRVGQWVSWQVWIVDTWMSFPRGDRDTAAAWQNPAAREDLLIPSYKISSTVTSGAELRATAMLTMRPQWSGEKLAMFALDSNLRATSVRDQSTGQQLEFRQPQEKRDRTQSYGDYIAVLFPEPLAAGQDVVLEFQYAGKRVVRSVGPGVFFAQSTGWYPARTNFALRSDFELTFRCPKKYELVASAHPVSDTVDGDDRITSWRTEKPVAVTGFAFGEIKIERTTAGQTEVIVYANRHADDFMRTLARAAAGGSVGPTGQQAAPQRTGLALGTLTPALVAKEIAIEMGNSIRLFEAYFGPYPYQRLAVSTIPFSYGQGWPSLIYLSALSFLDSSQRNQLGIRGAQQKEITDFFRAHESSHQWWGHKVAWKSYHDQWLSEGFAEFSGNLYLQLRTSHKEFLQRLTDARRNLLQKDENGHVFDQVGPIWMGRRLFSSQSPGSPGKQNAYAQLVYEKGGFVLHMLRMMLVNPQSNDPDGRFKAMMREFTSKFDNAAASTEDFKALAEKHMLPEMDLDGNGRLDWFFDQYVYGIGIPQYEFRYAVTDAGGGKWKLAGEIKQSGVREGWKDVLPLYLEVNRNVFRVGTISMTQSMLTFEETLPVKPERVVLCLNEDSIGVIKQ